MCYRCIRPQPACICGFVRKVDNATRVLIIQHPRERRHPFGTARLARLGLGNVEVRVAFSYRSIAPPPEELVDAAVLYPGPTAALLGPEGPKPSTLVVVDGTWSSAGKVIRDHAWLRDLPRVGLEPKRAGRYRIRKAPDPSKQLSTIEAIALALEAIEPETPGLDGLGAAFDSMIDRQLELQGNNPRFKKKQREA